MTARTVGRAAAVACVVTAAIGAACFVWGSAAASAAKKAMRARRWGPLWLTPPACLLLVMLLASPTASRAAAHHRVRLSLLALERSFVAYLDSNVMEHGLGIQVDDGDPVKGSVTILPHALILKNSCQNYKLGPLTTISNHSGYENWNRKTALVIPCGNADEGKTVFQMATQACEAMSGNSYESPAEIRACKRFNLRPGLIELGDAAAAAVGLRPKQYGNAVKAVISGGGVLERHGTTIYFFKNAVINYQRGRNQRRLKQLVLTASANWVQHVSTTWYPPPQHAERLSSPLMGHDASAKAGYVTPNAAVVAQLKKAIRPIAAAALFEYRRAGPRRRLAALDTNLSGLVGRAVRAYVVELSAYSAVTHKQGDYYLRAEIPVGERVTAANAIEVGVYVPARPVPLSVAAQSGRDGTEGSNDVEDFPIYLFSTQRGLASDYNSPSTPLENREVDWDTQLRYARGPKGHPDRFTFRNTFQGGWHTYQFGMSSQILDVIMPQALEIARAAEAHAKITLPAELCRSSHQFFVGPTCAAQTSGTAGTRSVYRR